MDTCSKEKTFEKDFKYERDPDKFAFNIKSIEALKKYCKKNTRNIGNRM